MLEEWKQAAGIAVGRQLAHPAGLGGRLIGAAMRVANRRPTRAVIEALDIQPTDRVLDIGCGDGSAIAAMTRASHVCGVDASATMLDVARHRNRRAIARGRISVRAGGMMNLPFDSPGFDKIAASNILYFCPDVPAFISECRRVAYPDARLVIFVTCRSSMRDWRFASPATHRHFDRDTLAGELERAGLPSRQCKIDRLDLPNGITGLVATVALASET
jgi:SAM-dependent methyltransferase